MDEASYQSPDDSASYQLSDAVLLDTASCPLPDAASSQLPDGGPPYAASYQLPDDARELLQLRKSGARKVLRLK
jgi:hypothetical protein